MAFQQRMKEQRDGEMDPPDVEPDVEYTPSIIPDPTPADDPLAPDDQPEPISLDTEAESNPSYTPLREVLAQHLSCKQTSSLPSALLF